MTESNTNPPYKFLYKWILPGLTGALACTYEMSLQKRLGREINSKTFARCGIAFIAGYIFTKYIFTSIEYHQNKQELNNQEVLLKQSRLNNNE